jgi:hypothetical protein
MPFDALAHRVGGDLGPRRDDHRLDAAGDGLQVRIGPIALDL